MKVFKVAILGCGTVGGGVARILLDDGAMLAERSGMQITLAKILDIFPESSSKRHGIPRSLFCGEEAELDADGAARELKKILSDPAIDLVVETIGGSSASILDTVISVLDSGKHLVTANKALLAKQNRKIFEAASRNNKAVGFEASVCGAIPVIKGINECMSGDEILSLSGIMNGTSNYILSKMSQEGLSFADALKGAQAKGYAEADPTLDVNGGDAGHKLLILLKLIFGIDVEVGAFPVSGIDSISADDTKFAGEIGAVIKLICFAKKEGNGVCAAVRPMMVRRSNILSDISNATNAVKLEGKYSRDNIFIGQGAGSLETGSAIVSDIVFIARYGTASLREYKNSSLSLAPFYDLKIAYTIIFETEDVPGITGLVTTAIGREAINIDTVSHNLREKGSANALFSIATMPCTGAQIARAVAAIRAAAPTVLIREPKVIPILE